MMHPAFHQLVYVPNFPHKDPRFAGQPPELIHQTVKINKGNFYFEKRLGKGAFGTVYAARNTSDLRPVAIKVVSLDPRNPGLAHGLTTSILSEIRMAKRLAKTSPHIVHMYDFDFDTNSGRAFIVMELGQSDLEKYLSARPRLNGQERKAIWKQLVHIATVLHHRGIVHLDIKPANLLVFSGNQIKLADLGIAQKANTFRNAPNGTPGFSAPEVVLGPHVGGAINTSKSDVWSWGAVLCRIAYGAGPRCSQTPHGLQYHHPAYVPPPGTPPSRDPLVLDVLKHTLVPIDRRVDVSWLNNHPFTRT